VGSTCSRGDVADRRGPRHALPASAIEASPAAGDEARRRELTQAVWPQTTPGEFATSARECIIMPFRGGRQRTARGAFSWKSRSDDTGRNGRGFDMRSDIVPGTIFPDYELSDHTAKHRKLSELQGQHPMVLVLSRGGFCPKDRRQAEGLVELHRELEVAYCRLVTISTDNITQTNEYRSGVGAHWPFLSDTRRIVQTDLDIAEYTDPVNNPMIPHVIVLEPGLVIYKIYNGYWFFGRPTLEELRQDLRAVTKKCRPDWDITTPELKAAWQQGRKDLFYPYGKTYVQTLGEQD
jgi:peroxiredoxin